MFSIKNGILVPNVGVKALVKQKNTPNRSGALIKPTVIIVHDTASGLNTNGPVDWLCNPVAKASAHFVVGRLGFEKDDVYQLAPTNVKTWHAGKSTYKGKSHVNNFSLGIEIVNPGWMTTKDGGKTVTHSTGAVSWNAAQMGCYQRTDDYHPGKYWWMSYTEQQFNAVVEICRALVKAYPTIVDIEPHYVVSPGRKVDVNPLFPLDRLRTAVFNNRGPVSAVVAETEESKNVPNIPPATNEKDAKFEYDAVTIAGLNIRPFPDSPRRFGVILKGRQVDIVRPSVSQKDGKVWYLVKVKQLDVVIDKGSFTDGDGFVRGFVSGAFLDLVD